MKKEYRIINYNPLPVQSNVEDGYTIYTINEHVNRMTYSILSPDLDKLAQEMEDYNPMKFYDPNELNDKFGLPPAYIFVDISKDIIQQLKEYLDKYFTIEEFDEYTYRFTGEPKCESVNKTR